MWARPSGGQDVVVAQEWVDRRYGTTAQFLTSFGQYNAATDEVECGDDGFIRARHNATKFHWWMPVYRPDATNVLALQIGNFILNGMPRLFMREQLSTQQDREAATAAQD